MVTVTESLQQIDTRIDVERDRLTDLQQRLQKERESDTSTSASRGALDDRVGDSRRLLRELAKARSNVEKGFTLESAITVAFGRASAATRGREARRQLDIAPRGQQFQRGRQVQPTQTEFELRQSLPSDIRDLPFEEITGGQTLRGGFTGLPALQVRPLQTLEDPFLQTRIPTQRQELLQTRLPSRQEQFLLQSVPEIRAVDGRPSARDVLFGEVGRPFVGFDILPRITPAFIPRERDVSLTQIQTALRAAPTDISLPGIPGTGGITEFLPRPSEFAGFGIRTGAELIPTTPGEIGITGGLVAASIFAPPIVGTGIGFGIAGLGVRTAFDPGLTIEQRVAGGVVGVLGGAGAVAGVTPFIRGFGARGVRVAPEGFQVLPGLKGVGDIGLIQPGKGPKVPPDLPPTSPLVRGGFGVRPGEKAQFLGPEQLLATSQRGFFEVGRDIPIEREFFVTPQEPTLLIAETRVSRLGLQDPFKIPKSIEIGFGLPKRPQIGVIKGEVAKIETPDAFALGRGTELEAIKTTGIITDVAQIGRVRIRGQGVDVFEFRVGRAPKGRAKLKRAPEDFFSTEGTARVSGETLLGTLGTRPTRGVTAVTSALISPLITAPTSPDIGIPISPPISFPVSPPIGPGVSPTPSDLISPALIPTVSPPTIPTIAPEIFPIFEDPLRRIRIPRRRKKKEKKVRKGKRITTPTRVSFTGIILGIEEAAFVDPRFGVSPLEIRGLATGLDVPTTRRTTKVKKKVSKKKSVKKKRKKKKN